MGFKHGLIATCASLMGLALMSAPSAGADPAAEAFVQVNATQAIAALDATGNAAERSAKFGAMMEQFSDLPAIAEFVLGRYAIVLKADPGLKQEWLSAFREYAIASYEDEFDTYRGSTVKVIGSRDSQQNAHACSRVNTNLTAKDAKPTQVFWYLCKPAGAAASWKVADVGLVVGDSEVKLALSQRDQFGAFLGANGGDVRKLIAKVRTQTQTMLERKNHNG